MRWVAIQIPFVAACLLLPHLAAHASSHNRLRKHLFEIRSEEPSVTEGRVLVAVEKAGLLPSLWKKWRYQWDRYRDLPFDGDEVALEKRRVTALRNATAAVKFVRELADLQQNRVLRDASGARMVIAELDAPKYLSILIPGLARQLRRSVLGLLSAHDEVKRSRGAGRSEIGTWEEYPFPSESGAGIWDPSNHGTVLSFFSRVTSPVVEMIEAAQRVSRFRTMNNSFRLPFADLVQDHLSISAGMLHFVEQHFDETMARLKARQAETRAQLQVASWFLNALDRAAPQLKKLPFVAGARDPNRCILGVPITSPIGAPIRLMDGRARAGMRRRLGNARGRKCN